MRQREQGSIEERVQGRKYLIRWTTKDETGRSTRHNEMITGDYVEAQSALSKKLRGQEAKPAERTFKSYMEREWAQYMRDKWKISTQITHGSFVTRHIRPYFDGLILSKITPSNIVAVHQSLEDKGLGKRSRRTIHAVVTTMFNYATDTLELIPKSPVRKGIGPKPDKREKPALTAEQGWILWDTLADKKTICYRAFYGVLLFTGIRTGEALGLKWEDLDFANRQITIRRAIYRGKETTPKTNTSLRTRPMSPDLYTATLNHRAMAVYTQPTDYVFASSSGRPMNPDQLREALQKVLREKLNIYLGPREDGLHLLRHTSGSLVFERTGSVKVAAGLARTWVGPCDNGHLRPPHEGLPTGHGRGSFHPARAGGTGAAELTKGTKFGTTKCN